MVKANVVNDKTAELVIRNSRGASNLRQALRLVSRLQIFVTSPFKIPELSGTTT